MINRRYEVREIGIITPTAYVEDLIYRIKELQESEFIDNHIGLSSGLIYEGEDRELALNTALNRDLDLEMYYDFNKPEYLITVVSVYEKYVNEDGDLEFCLFLGARCMVRDRFIAVLQVGLL